MKSKTFMLAAALCAAGMAAQAAQIAILANNGGRHKGEFATALSENGWDATLYYDTNESMAKLGAEIDQYEMIIMQPLYAYKAPAEFNPDLAPLKRWIEAGGLFVITDGSYEGPRALVEKMDKRLGGLKTGNCTSSQWSVNGYTSNVEPVHTTRAFPNLLTDGDSWPHFEEVEKDSPWKVITRCSQGNPVILFAEMGKGAILLSTLRQQAPKALENYYAYSQLKKSGLSVAKFALSDFKPGPGNVAITLEKEPPAGSKVVYSISGKDSRGRAKVESFEAVFDGLVAQTNFVISSRGEVDVKLCVVNGDKETIVSTRHTKLPRLLEVGANAYRGMLSTKRRLDDVQFPVYFAPEWENLTGADISFEIYDAMSNRCSSAAYTLPTNDVPAQMWFKVPLAKTAMPGGYAVRVVLDQKPRKGVRPFKAGAEAAFEIVPPKPYQTVIDEDQTFLVNGVPFFPLGLYHCGPGEFDQAAKIGFNTVQFWSWHSGNDPYGVSTAMYKALGNGMRCLFESAHLGEHVYRSQCEKFRENPAMLMWYLADEPNEGMAKDLHERQRLRHTLDPNHPTFVASCRPDLFTFHASFADVFAMDPYGDEKKFVTWCRKAEKEVAPHKPVVVVPWADSKDKDSTNGAKIVPLQAWTAIVHGARGIIWYCWRQAGGGPIGIGLGTNPENQEIYKTLIAQIKEVVPGITSVNRRTFEEGDVHGIVCGDRSRFLILVNTNESEPQTLDLALPELKNVKKVNLTLKKVAKLDKDGKEVKDRQGNVVLTDDTLTLEKPGSFTGTLAPGETVVWRW